MVTRNRVQILRGAGHTVDDVAKRTGVSPGAVKRIASEGEVTSLDDGAERQRRRVGRPRAAERWRADVEQLVKEADSEGRPLQSKEIVRRLRLKEYKGGKSAAYTLIASLRDDDVELIVRFEGLPGEFCQHDFGQVNVRFIDSVTKRVKFFASRLKYSRRVAVSLVHDETAETIGRGVIAHYDGFGGVPLVGVFDRPKTVALRWTKDGVVTAWNKVMAGVMLELSVAIEVCWPRKGNQKGSVENLVGYVKGSFFKQRTFRDDADLREQLVAWEHEVNEVVPCRATGVTPRTRMAEEGPRLRPLKVRPEALALRIPVVVRPGAWVEHGGHRYQLPPATIGRAGTLYVLQTQMRVVVGNHDVVYARPARGSPPQHLTSPQLKEALVHAAKGPRGKLYLKRQQLLDLGQWALDFLTELVHRKPRTWAKDVERLHALALSHTDDAMRTAFRNALAGGGIGAEYVAHHLGHVIAPRLSVVANPVAVAPVNGALARSRGDGDGVGDGSPLHQPSSLSPRTPARRGAR